MQLHLVFPVLFHATALVLVLKNLMSHPIHRSWQIDFDDYAILGPLHRTLTKQWKNHLKDLEKVQLIIKRNIRLKVCLSLKVCMAYPSGISFLGSVFNTSSTMTGPWASCKNHNFFSSFLRQMLSLLHAYSPPQTHLSLFRASFVSSTGAVKLLTSSSAMWGCFS